MSPVETIAFALIWVGLSGWIVVHGLRSGEALFILRTTVTRAEDAYLYWPTIVFWLLAFAFFTYTFARLTVDAALGIAPFDARTLLPGTAKQWILAGGDILLFMVFGYIAWSRARLRRLLREIEAEESSDAQHSIGAASADPPSGPTENMRSNEGEDALLALGCESTSPRTR